MTRRAKWAGLVGLVGLFGCSAASEVSLEIQAQHAAQSELGRFLHAIPAARMHDFGFQDQSELERATVTMPFRMAAPDPTGEPELLDVWRVPVVVDGEYRALLTVRLRDGEMHCDEIGGSGLARELQHAPREARVLLRAFELRSDFVVGRSTAWPLQSARQSLQLPPGAVELRELRPLLRSRKSR